MKFQIVYWREVHLQLGLSGGLGISTGAWWDSLVITTIRWLQSAGETGGPHPTRVSAEVERVHTVSCQLMLSSQDQDVEDKRIKCEIYKVGASSPKRIIHFSASMKMFLAHLKDGRKQNIKGWKSKQTWKCVKLQFVKWPLEAHSKGPILK